MIGEIPISVLIASVLAASAPLIIIALGEMITEKSGVINLSLDGAVLFSAMVAFVVAKESGSLVFGFLAGGCAGMVTGLGVGYFSIYLHLSQVAVGFALSLLCRDARSRLRAPLFAPGSCPGSSRCSQPGRGSPDCRPGSSPGPCR